MGWGKGVGTGLLPLHRVESEVHFPLIIGFPHLGLTQILPGHHGRPWRDVWLSSSVRRGRDSQLKETSLPQPSSSPLQRTREGGESLGNLLVKPHHHFFWRIHFGGTQSPSLGMEQIYFHPQEGTFLET